MDGTIGLIPGFGDAIADPLLVVVPLAAWVRGVSYVALVRMVVNLEIAVLTGPISLLGDAFDRAWKANRRNFCLLQWHISQPCRHTWRDRFYLLHMRATSI
jgi:hypothetical protein